MKQTPKHNIKYPEGTDLVRNASAQFEAMAVSIDDNIDDLPDTIIAKVNNATERTEKAAADAEKYSGAAVALQDGAISGRIDTDSSATRVSLDRLRSYAGLNVVAVGDSFGMAYHGDRSWAERLRTVWRMNVTNVCNDGSGFARTGYKTFSDEINEAYNTLGAGKAAGVHAVVIAGGVNDPDDWSNNLDTRITDTLKNARAKFPNARVIVVPQLWRNTKLPVNRRGMAYYTYAQATSQGCEYVPWAWTWRYGLPDTFVEDGLHPNEAGALLIASYIVQAIGGNYHGRTVPMTSATDQNTGLTCYFSAHGGTVEANMFGTIPDGKTTNGLKFAAKLADETRNPYKCPFKGTGAGYTQNGNRVFGAFLDSYDGQLILSCIQQPLAGDLVLPKDQVYSGQTGIHITMNW